MIVFIGCGKSKQAYAKIQAYKMYTGTFFSTCLQYALTLTDRKHIYILSARYGVLDLDDIITTYNITLNNATQEYCNNWTKKVKAQFFLKHITQDTPVTMLCGKNYYKGLLDYFYNINIPLESYSGMGYQIEFMKKEITKAKTIFKIK